MFNFLKGFTDHHKKAIAKLYVASNFSVYDLETELQSFYKKTSQNELTFKRITNGFTVDVDIQNITKKEIITTTRLQLLQNETIIYVVAEHIEIDLSSF